MPRAADEPTTLYGATTGSRPCELSGSRLTFALVLQSRVGQPETEQVSKNQSGPRERHGVDVTVGRSAADYLQAMPTGTESDAPDDKPDNKPEDAPMDSAPESALSHPVRSEFRRELLERLEVAGRRAASEANHLDAVERVVADYQSIQRPTLRLLP